MITTKRAVFLWYIGGCIVALLQCSLASEYSVPNDFETIQEAIETAVDGDIVTIEVGTYLENLDLSGKAISHGSASSGGGM